MTTSGRATADASSVARAIRTPRSAALAGVVFSLLFATSLVMLRIAVPGNPNDAGEWLSDGPRRDVALAALALVPFEGLAFLWFIGVVRDRIGDAEDRFFASVFLGTGLLFVATLFVAGAIAASLVASAEDIGESLFTSGAWEVGRRTAYELIDVYAMRMAGVFTIVTSTILLRTGLAPRWLLVSGYAVGVLLLVASGVAPWIELAFPAWVLALSLHVLAVGFRRARMDETAGGA